MDSFPIEVFPLPKLEKNLVVKLYEIKEFQIDLYLQSGKFLIKKIGEAYRKLLDYFEGPSRLGIWRETIYTMVIQIIMDASDQLETKKMKDIYLTKLKFPNGFYIMEELERVLMEQEEDWRNWYPWPAYGFEHLPKPKAYR
jgi:hypothetical protein